MKKVILTIFILAFAVSTQAQFLNSASNEQTQATGQFSIGPLTGIMIPLGTTGDAYKVSFSIGAELGYMLSPQFEIVENSFYHFLSNKFAADVSTSAFEFTAGPRYYFTPVGTKIFGEFQAGLWNGRASQGNFSNSVTDFEINGGIGIKTRVGTKTDIIGKVRFHNVFSTPNNATMFSFHGGVLFGL